MTAAAVMVGGFSLLQLLVLIIVVAAAIAILYVILQQLGVAIPPFLVQTFWILVAAVVGVMALVILFRMIGDMGP